MKRLSVIIVTYNSEKDIYDCLQSIWQYCDIPHKDLEVIVVDNSEECEPMFTKLHQLYGEKVTLIHNTYNGGYGQGNNIGIHAATSSFIMIMNPDVRLCMPLFRTALDAFSRDPSLCMYGMKQMLSPTVKSPLSFDCSRRMNGYLIPFIASICNKLDLYIPTLMTLAGSCFFISKPIFQEVGLFDEDIFMYGEEDDIHYRIKQKYNSHFRYNSHLAYIHQTLVRPMSLATEKKMVESIVLSYEKKGYLPKETCQNLIRYYRSRLLSAIVKKWLGKKYVQQHINILKDTIRYLKERRNCMQS